VPIWVLLGEMSETQSHRKAGVLTVRPGVA
jgi:hypothetical protein